MHAHMQWGWQHEKYHKTSPGHRSNILAAPQSSLLNATTVAHAWGSRTRTHGCKTGGTRTIKQTHRHILLVATGTTGETQPSKEREQRMSDSYYLNFMGKQRRKGMRRKGKSREVSAGA